MQTMSRFYNIYLHNGILKKFKSLSEWIIQPTWLLNVPLVFIFHLHGDAIITGNGLQTLSLCSAGISFEKAGFFFISQLTGPRILRSHLKDRDVSNTLFMAFIMVRHVIQSKFDAVIGENME